MNWYILTAVFIIFAGLTWHAMCKASAQLRAMNALTDEWDAIKHWCWRHGYTIRRVRPNAGAQFKTLLHPNGEMPEHYQHRGMADDKFYVSIDMIRENHDIDRLDILSEHTMKLSSDIIERASNLEKWK